MAETQAETVAGARTETVAGGPADARTVPEPSAPPGTPRAHDAPRTPSVPRAPRPRARHLRAALLFGLAGALVTGCASMPDSGDVRGVEASQRPDSQVRVFAVPPREDDDRWEIIQGFLEALTSDDPHYEIARKYLTKSASKHWHPEASTTVLAEGPAPVPLADHGGYDATDGSSYVLKGAELATVDSEHAYQPGDNQYAEPVHLTTVRSGGHRVWRIDRPPTGIVLGLSDFQRIYRPVDKYYYANARTAGGPGSAGAGDTAGTAGGHGAEPGRLVADPIYVRQGVDPVTQTVAALLAGPTRWLQPAVHSSFPARTRLKPGTRGMAPDDQNRLKVPLSEEANLVGHEKCRRMAAQIVFTLQDLTSTGIAEVTLVRSDGSALCELDADDAESVVPLHGDRTQYQYFLDSDHHLVRLPGTGTGSDDAPEPVPGPLGGGEDAKELGKVAVARDEESAAGVTTDGHELYVATLASRTELGDPVLTSSGKSADDRLTAPSWDGHGDLWVADRDPSHPRLLVLGHGTGDPVEVGTPGLDGRIKAVRVAADGVRIALLVERDGKESLYVGRIQRTAGADDAAGTDDPDGTGDSGGAGDDHSAGNDGGAGAKDQEDGGTEVTVAELRPAAPQMEKVTAASWAGGSRLVVVGRETGGVQQLRYVQCDGSAPASGVLPGLTGVAEIAAAEDDRLPLVALSDDGIVRMLPGGPWQTVGEGNTKGTSPVYPG